MRTSLQVGVNYSGMRSYRAVHALLKSGHVDFVEVVVDNFFDVDPGAFIRFFGQRDVAFHIMFSRFLECETDELKDLAARIRTLRDVLAPIYVSDHLLRFTHAGMRLPYLQELAYDDETLSSVRGRVALWQDLLGEQVLLENFPSMDRRGVGQADFFEALARDTGCGVLMDLSNLFVAQENGGDSYREWRSTLESCAYFHIAGARRSPIDEGFWIDSHDCAIEPEILLFAERCWSARNPTHKTRFISVERDHNISARSWRRDIRHVRERLSGHRREIP